MRISPAADLRQAAASLTQHAGAIKRLGKRVVTDVMEIGQRLTESKALCGHGRWLRWLDRELGWSADTAERFIQVHALSDQIPQLAEFNLPISGLYLLAAPSTPDEARVAIIERAKAGEAVSTKTIKNTIAQRKQSQRRLPLADEQAKPSLVTGVAMASHAERGLDLYETPPVAVHALLKVEPLVGRIWEPACGPGAIVRVLRDAGHDVVATDIKNYGCPDARCVDFLGAQKCSFADIILTNPPYRLANKFVRHALKLTPRVVMLLPLRFLEGAGRSDILDGGQLARVYVFRNRLPMMHRHGWRGAKIKSGAIAFAWFLWNREHSGPATIHRVSWEQALTTETESSIPDYLSIPPFLHRGAAS